MAVLGVHVLGLYCYVLSGVVLFCRFTGESTLCSVRAPVPTHSQLCHKVQCVVLDGVAFRCVCAKYRTHPYTKANRCIGCTCPHITCGMFPRVLKCLHD